MANIKSCSASNCKNSYRNDKFGNMRAQSVGWFLQRNGKSWCPEHVPEWVEEWRKKNGK